MTEFYAELEQQVEGYLPGSFARALHQRRRAARRPSAPRTGYSAAQEAADLATLDRIEHQRQDYFDGMGEIHARQLSRGAP